MYIKRKTRFRLLVFLIVASYAALHVFARSDRGKAAILRCLSEKSGLCVKAAKTRLTPGLSLRLDDVAVSSASCGDASGGAVVFTAPRVTLSLRRLGVRAEANAGARISIPRPATGNARFDRIAGAFCGESGATVYSFGKASENFGCLYFSVSGATVTVASKRDGGEPDGTGAAQSGTVFSGVCWSRRPVRLSGHPGAVYDRLEYNGGPVWAENGDDAISPCDALTVEDEWFELGIQGEVARFWSENRPAGPRLKGNVCKVKPPRGTAEEAGPGKPNDEPTPVEAQAAAEPPEEKVEPPADEAEPPAEADAPDTAGEAATPEGEPSMPFGETTK